MGFAAGYGLAFMSWIQFFYICEFGQCVQVSWLSLPLKKAGY